MLFKVQHDEFGREVANQDRLALPAGWDRPLSLAEQIKRMVRTELSRQAVDGGMESFEEADDFDIPDEEGDFVSPYEVVEMAPEGVSGPDPDPPTGPAEKTAPEAAKAVPGASAVPGSGDVAA